MKIFPRKSTSVLQLTILLLPIWLHAQSNDGKKEALAIRYTTNFDISGKGDAAAWQQTTWIPLERRRGNAPYQTRAKLLYSETGIYALFSCQDSKISATFQEDFADLWTEDVVEIFLWPNDSESIYFEYELSPLNKELPIIVPNMDGDFLGWRPWHYEGERRTRHATHVARDGRGNTTEWIAEFFIPYALLKPLRNVPPKSGTKWRMNMYRVDHDDGSTSWSWKPVRTNFHDYKSFGVIQFQ